MKTYQYRIYHVDCANCASKIEDKMKHIQGVESVNYSFMNQKLAFECDESQIEEVESKMNKIVHAIEPDAKIEKIKSRLGRNVLFQPLLE